MCEIVKKKIEEEKLIVIVRGVEKEKLIPLANALYAGGVRLMEVTFDATGKTPDEEIAEEIALLVNHFDGKMHIGAGTVLSEKQVLLTKNAGGCFIISPDVNEAVIAKTKAMGLVSIPGALTPTEVQNAHRCGADMIKLFPVDTFGPSYCKAIRAPLSHVRLLAVGGINEENISVYRKAGVCGFGVGSNIIDRNLLDKDNYEALAALAQRYVMAAKSEL